MTAHQIALGAAKIQNTEAFVIAQEAYSHAFQPGGLLHGFAEAASPKLDAVAEALGVSATVAEFPADAAVKFAGFLLPRQNGGRGLIVINSALSQAEQIEAMAHELAHVVLHMDMVLADNSFGEHSALMQIRDDLSGVTDLVEQDELKKMSQTSMEVEADAFARLLLLPLATMEKVKDKGWDDAAIADRLTVPLRLVEMRQKDPDVAALSLTQATSAPAVQAATA
jgi:IrrE N-terminal-like domain